MRPSRLPVPRPPRPDATTPSTVRARATGPAAGPLAALLLLLVAAGTTLAQNGRSAADPPDAARGTVSGWTPEQSVSIRAVGNVRPGPNGHQVLLEVSEAVMDETTSAIRTHVHLAAADGSSMRQLTRGDASCSHARWSPDGRWIAFLSSRGGEHGNLWRIRVDGGEAERLTGLDASIETFAWSADGTRIAFVSPDPTPESRTKAEEARRDALVVGSEDRVRRVRIVPAEPDADGARPVTTLDHGPGSISGIYGRATLDWSPDGSLIACAVADSPRIDDWPSCDLVLLPTDGSGARRLVSGAAAEGDPRFSPDGATVAFRMTVAEPIWPVATRVHLVPTAGGDVRALATTPDERGSIIGWSAAGDQVLVEETWRTVDRVFAVPTDGSASFGLTPPDVMVSDPVIDHRRSRLGFTGESSDRPPDGFVTSLENFEPVQVSDVHELPGHAIGVTEVITWTTDDGLTIEGLLTYPVGYQLGQRVPLLTIVHGGPAGVFTQRFIARRSVYPIAAFASRGYAVLRPNPRGSSGYGREFRYRNVEDWGGADSRDILAGVDHVVEMGVADPDRLGIMGWSYGGYMTSWIIGNDPRFRAASIGGAVTNLISFTGTTDIPDFLASYMNADHWEAPERWWERSPIAHVGRITTPSLIQHGERDERVPLGQAAELHTALRRRGVPTTMIVYPRQGHGVREPKLRAQAMQANLDWFERWIGRAESAEPPSTEPTAAEGG